LCRLFVFSNSTSTGNPDVYLHDQIQSENSALAAGAFRDSVADEVCAFWIASRPADGGAKVEP